MQIQSPFRIDSDIDGHPTFADYFLASTVGYGTRLAMVDTESGQHFRFSEFQRWVDTCTKRLGEIGVAANSCIALVASTNPSTIFVHLAAAKLGCRVALLSGFLAIDDIWYQIMASDATVCIIESQFTQRIEDVRRKALIRGSEKIRVFKRLDEVIGNTPLQKREFWAQLAQLQKEQKELDLADNDTASVTPCSVATFPEKTMISSASERSFTSELKSDKLNSFLILFSSGTSRQPKPIQVSHQTVITNLRRLQCQIYAPPQPGDRFLLTMCQSTIFGFYSVYHPLLNGAELYTVRKHSNKIFLKALMDHKITHTHVTPPLIHFLASDLSLENVNLKAHLRCIISGGAPLDARIAQQCKERLGIRDFRQVYGMTEVGGPCLFTHVGCDNIETVGRPLPGVVAKIMQWDNKKTCEPRQMGQLLIGGINIDTNFLCHTKTTSDMVTSDGYIKTGDAAFFDESGLIYVIDRIKDIIRYRGNLVYPSDIECKLRSHPGIEDCAVVGRQDYATDDVPIAFVVKRHSNLMLSTAEIRQHISGKIPQFKELRGGVFFVTEIPRGICGKVLRQNLRQYWDRERLSSRSDNNRVLLRDNTNNQKPMKVHDMLSKSRRSASITTPSTNKLIRPEVRRYQRINVGKSNG